MEGQVWVRGLFRRRRRRRRGMEWPCCVGGRETGNEKPEQASEQRTALGQ